MALAPGTRLGPYEIQALLGAGGMGEVYRARDMRLKRQVAIKLLPPDLTRDARAKRRFLQEAQAASALDHPNICTIYEIDETGDGQLYLVMAYYEGETLRQRVTRGPLKLDAAIDIATQVGEGLAEAHGAGIVHRDIKPANLLIAKTGTVKILDFGLAKLAGAEGVTQTGMTVGTLAYMSPEQARGEEVDHRTDIWSLGVVLYEMLTGQQPFLSENLLAIADAIRSHDPVPLSGDAASASGVVSCALEKVVAKRYQSVTDFLSDLTRVRPLHGPTASAPDLPSIAVLPFANMSADPEQEYFCDGLAEELIDALARLDTLRVVARTSAFQFKAQSLDVAEIGKRLRVRYVLEGSVRKAGNRLRINAQLINTDDGYHVWSERYDRVMDDIFEIQEDISRSILDKLKLRLTKEAHRAIGQRYGADVDAYNLYLKGRYHLHKRTPDGFRRAADNFERVMQRDSRLAPAYAGLAECYAAWAWYGGLAAPEAIAKARQLALAALKIDPELGQAHYALGLIAGSFEWNWPEAERAFAQALRLNPNNAVGRWWYAFFCLAPTGRLEEAIDEVQQSLALEPLSPLMQTVLGIGLMFRRDYDTAVKSFDAALELEPNFPLARGYLGETYCHQRKYEEAVVELRQAQPSAPGCHFSVGFLGYCYGRWGKTGDAERLVSHLQELSETTYIPALSFAMAHIGMNHVDRTFEYLNQAYEERCGALAWIRLDPMYDPLRSDSRFQALLRRMNFPETTATAPWAPC